MLSPVGLTTPEWIDISVAAGTAALAVATFILARSARDQANATARLAKIAEGQLEVERRHVEATTLPVLRIARTGHGQEGLVWIDADDLRLTVENQGAASARVERSTINLPRGGGAEGAPVGSDVVEPEGGQLTIDFSLSREQLDRATSGDEVMLQVIYRAPGAERKKALQAVVKPKDGGDRWIVLRDPIKDV